MHAIGFAQRCVEGTERKVERTFGVVRYARYSVCATLRKGNQMAYIRHHASTSTITSRCEVRITCRRVASCTPSTSKDSVVFTPSGFRKLSARSASKRSVVCTLFGGNFVKLREPHGVIRRYASMSTTPSHSANRMSCINTTLHIDVERNIE